MKAQELTELLENGEKTPDEICPVIYVMSILGQRWKLPILWHLADEGTLRYNEIKRGIPLITNIMLTQALRELEKSHLVDRLNYDTIPPHVEYSLSERGKTLIPILKDIHAWGKDQMEIVTAKAQKG
ncbi:MAG: winged helix-turn-helix transcriptional regulator [Clostridia bacterium]|nr:winged helix-turn-helix transcriptional regulator [Clostridia bacterium]